MLSYELRPKQQWDINFICVSHSLPLSFPLYISVSDFILGKTLYTVVASISMKLENCELENFQENVMLLTLA